MNISWLVRLFVAWLVATAIPLHAKDPTSEQLAADQHAAQLGKRIYLHDQAAWHGTDALFELIEAKDHPELRGYLTEERPDGLVDIIFYAEYDGALYEFSRHTVDGSKVVGGAVNAEPRDYPLSPLLTRQVAARDAALSRAQAEKVGLCTDASPNFVVLPPDADDLVSVYLLSAQVENEKYPLGGHYLYRVDSTGKVVSSRNFMNSCMQVPVAGGEVGTGNKLVGFVVSHILDDHPTEIHYFVARYTRLPISVSTDGYVWKVSAE